VKYITLTFLLFFFSQCRSTMDARTNDRNYEKSATAQLGKSFECQPNETNTMMLCLSISTDIKKFNSGNYAVISKKTGVVIYQNTLDNTQVTWYSDNEISLFNTPGMMRENDSKDNYTFIYNLNTKEQTRKVDLQK